MRVVMGLAQAFLVGCFAWLAMRGPTHTKTGYAVMALGAAFLLVNTFSPQVWTPIVGSITSVVGLMLVIKGTIRLTRETHRS